MSQKWKKLTGTLLITFILNRSGDYEMNKKKDIDFLNWRPLLIYPELAKEIGVNEAILLQQLNYWLERTKHNYKGEKCVHKTMEEWNKEIPFVSEITIKRTVKNLKNMGLIKVKRAVHTQLYSIDFNKLNKLKEKIDLKTELK